MIETVMLVMLGFLAATLLALIVAPAFWHRAVRLTSQRIRNTTPISEAEIRADKDLMRAEYAVRVHQLEREIEKAKLGAHRQFIEINRRDASVTRLEGELEALKADRDEHHNARRVLEQTVNDRLPKLEGRLDEARQLIRARDTAIGELNEGARRQEASLEEARAINAQLSGEVERLKSYLSDLGTRDRRRAADVGVETEYALRAEIEQLRTRSREQVQLITSLQARLGSAGEGAGVVAAAEGDDAATLHVRLAEQAAEIARLESLVETRGKGAEPAAEAVHAPTLMEKLRSTETRLQKQSEEAEQLRRELDLTRRPDADSNSQVRESRALLKARLDRITSELEREKEQTQRLKSELAAANERAARQAAHHMEEMRHLGARASAAPRPAQSNGGLTVRALRAAGQGDSAPATTARPARVLTAFGNASSVRVRELNRAFSAEANAVVDGAAEPDPEAETPAPTPAAASEPGLAAASGGGTSEAAAANDAETESPDHRSRLLERLRTYED